jgi:hypothetical protein
VDSFRRNRKVTQIHEVTAWNHDRLVPHNKNNKLSRHRNLDDIGTSAIPEPQKHLATRSQGKNVKIIFTHVF